MEEEVRRDRERRRKEAETDRRTGKTDRQGNAFWRIKRK